MPVPVRCGSGEHNVVLQPDWGVQVPHDLEAERTAAAFGGSCDCLQLVDRVVPAARRWLELQLRAEVPQLAVTATGRPLAPCRVCPGPVRSQAGDLLAVVDHLRSIEPFVGTEMSALLRPDGSGQKGENIVPIRWTLTLEKVERSHELRPVTPRHLHAAACSLLEGAETMASHHGQRKPFVVQPPVLTRAAQELEWTLTWVSQEPPPSPPVTGSRVRFGSQWLAVKRVTARDRAFPDFLSADPPSRVLVNFPTGATFSRDKVRHYPLPDPETFFAGLLRRWRAFAPAPLRVDDELAGQLLGSVVLLGCQIATTEVAVSNATRPVFIGQADLGVLSRDPVVRAVFGTMLRWAEWSGAGALTTHGLGVVELLTPVS